MKKSRIVIIVVSATLTIGTFAFAAGMKHCHKTGNHKEVCGMSSDGDAHQSNCHHLETTAE